MSAGNLKKVQITSSPRQTKHKNKTKYKIKQNALELTNNYKNCKKGKM